MFGPNPPVSSADLAMQLELPPKAQDAAERLLESARAACGGLAASLGETRAIQGRTMQPTRDELVAEIAAALPGEYQLVEPKGSPAPVDLPPAPIGSGGSSVVFRALYRNRLHRAIKVMIPRDDLLAALDLSNFVESYENEVARLAELSHENLAKITDFGTIALSGVDYPYIAMEYIDGIPLTSFAEHENTTAGEIQDCLFNVLAALEYMHQSGVMHCDLKPDNILVRRDTTGRATAIVGDLGASRTFGDGADNKELLYFYSTMRYVIRDLRFVLSNRTRNRITRSDLHQFFPAQDLHSFGQVLDDLLCIPAVAEKIRNGLGANYARALTTISSSLTADTGTSRHRSASGISAALRRVDPSSVTLLGIPELSATPHRGIVIPSLGGRVSSSQRVDAAISHPFYQRLRNLPQLDLLQLVFPGATHTRFVHGLHTYALVRQGLLHLMADWRFRIEVSREDLEAVLAYATFSQLGHYHFLHMFEDFIAARQGDDRIARAGLLRDDEVLDLALGDMQSPLKTAIDEIRDQRGRTLNDVLEPFGLPWQEVRRRMTSPANPLEGALAALLSGPVDAEKLSYLCDDSAATGVPFGRSVVGAPIFEAMLIPSQEDWKTQGGASRIALGVREAALSYLEQDILARYWNIQTAYWNRTNRSIQAMLKFQIGQLIAAGRLEFDQYIAETLHLGVDGAMRWLNSHFLDTKRAGLIDERAVNPMEGILRSDRATYRRLVTISGQSKIPGREPDHRIFERARGMSPLDDIKLVSAIESALRSVDPKLDPLPGEVLIDLPRPRREEAGGKILVYTDNSGTMMGELFTISPFLAQHRESFELNVKRMRVFLNPRIYGRLMERGLRDRAYDAALESLRGGWGGA